MEDELEAFLSHYGVKGMKWGIRRDKTKTKAYTGASKPVKKNSNRGSRAGTRTYDVTKLNNKELSAVVKRMRLEQEYANLNKDPQKKKKGSNFATKFLKEEGGKFLKKNALPIAAGLVGGAFGAAMAGNLDEAAKNLKIDWDGRLTK
jgi:hypothetical protein